MANSLIRTPIVSNCVVNHSAQARAKRLLRRAYRRYARIQVARFEDVLPDAPNEWNLPSDGKRWSPRYFLDNPRGMSK